MNYDLYYRGFSMMILKVMVMMVDVMMIIVPMQQHRM